MCHVPCHSSLECPDRSKKQDFLSVLLGLALVTGFICCIRTSFTWQVGNKDPSWQGLPNAISRAFEVFLGLIGAQAPMLKPFVLYVHAHIVGRDPTSFRNQRRARQLQPELNTISASQPDSTIRLRMGEFIGTTVLGEK